MARLRMRGVSHEKGSKTMGVIDTARDLTSLPSRPHGDGCVAPGPHRKCPACGRNAVELLRTTERAGLFVWFECPDPACRTICIWEFPCR